MRLELSRFVESDLEAIADFIAQDNPPRAVSFLQEIRRKILQVGEQPLLYQLRPEIGVDTRLAVAGNYLILFHITGNVVRIERVVYGGRDLPHLYQQE